MFFLFSISGTTYILPHTFCMCTICVRNYLFPCTDPSMQPFAWHLLILPLIMFIAYSSSVLHNALLFSFIVHDRVYIYHVLGVLRIYFNYRLIQCTLLFPERTLLHTLLVHTSRELYYSITCEYVCSLVCACAYRETNQCTVHAICRWSHNNG